MKNTKDVLEVIFAAFVILASIAFVIGFLIVFPMAITGTLHGKASFREGLFVTVWAIGWPIIIALGVAIWKDLHE